MSEAAVGTRLPRPFLWLIAGDAASSYGSQLNMVALSLFAYQAAGNALGTAGYLVLRLAGGFVAGLLAGRLTTRFDRRKVMIGCALSQAAGLVALTLTPGQLRITVLWGLAALFGAAGSFSAVALRSSIPEMVGEEHRVRANGLMVTGRSTAMVLGFASAGVVVAWAGFRAALLVDAASFLVFGAVMAWLPLRTRAERRPAEEAGAADDPRGPEESSWRAGYLLLRALPVIGAMVAIRLVDAFGSAAHNVGMPVYASIRDPGNPAAMVGLFWAFWAVGSLGAHQLVTRLLLRRGREPGERAFAIGTILMSTCFILAFTPLPLPVLLAVAVGAGLADGFTEISYTSRIQAVEDERRGQAFGLVATAESLGMGVGMLLSAPLLELFAPFTVVAVSHSVPILLALGFLLLTARLAHRHRRTTEVPGPTGPLSATESTTGSGNATGSVTATTPENRR
ncbi:MFS transporter [Kitasatospora sp. HPMI-4]|uniref:MFS transporter n=1 Tax=Kitasatospora sp. HPMI-4 TaxID=3448443 RepID=UPI003F1D897E